MDAHLIELQPASGTGSMLGVDMEVAAHAVSEWLADDQNTVDKPVADVLSPEYAGMFAFYDDPGEGEPQQPPAGYIAQRQLKPAEAGRPAIHEVSSVVVNPSFRGQRLGKWLVGAYTYDLQTEFLEDDSVLVAVVHAGSEKLFTDAGFVPHCPINIPGDTTELAKRAQADGKFLVMRTMDQIPPIV